MNERAGIWCEKHYKFSESGACADCAAAPPVPVETPAIPPMLSLLDVARDTPAVVPVIEAVCERNQHLHDGPMTATEVMERHAALGAELRAAGERAMEGMQEFLKEKILDLRPLLERIRKAEIRRAWGDMRELARIASIDDAPLVPLSPPSVFREMLRLLTAPNPLLENAPYDPKTALRFPGGSCATCLCGRYIMAREGHHLDDDQILHAPHACRGAPVMFHGVELIPDATLGPNEIRPLPPDPPPPAYEDWASRAFPRPPSVYANWWKKDARRPQDLPQVYETTCFCGRWHFRLESGDRVKPEKITRDELHSPDRCGRINPSA